jgi:hypothetical protein
MPASKPRSIACSIRALPGACPKAQGRSGTDAILLALRADFEGDRVAVFIAGMGGMLNAAFDEKTEFFMLDDLDPQKLYNSARNLEIAAWKLANARDAAGALLLLSNEMAQATQAGQPEFRARIRQDDRQPRPALAPDRRQGQSHHRPGGAKRRDGGLPAGGGTAMKRYVILISGRGSNMESLLDAGLPGQCAAVISNRPDAAGLAGAASRGIATRVIDHRGFASREEFDAALAAEIERHAPGPGAAGRLHAHPGGTPSCAASRAAC